MADYDPKSIPILDDVIDKALDDKKTGAEAESAENNSTTEDTAADDNLDLFNGETSTPETETIESALIDYQPEEAEIDGLDVIETTAEIQPASDIQSIHATPAIDTIVDDVVKQVMPDLEQQLRFLIQQALEEKLGKSNS